jgi:GNAT superfamily N-acetyltransferase
MDRESLEDAFRLISAFLGQDEYYLDSRLAYGDRGAEGVLAGLELFLERTEMGFVWLAYDGDEAVGICIISFAISTSAGALVAKLDDVFVKDGRRGRGIGSALMDSLKAELRRLGVRRIDTSVHLRNAEARRFYLKHAFQPLNEERLSCLL